MPTEPVQIDLETSPSAFDAAPISDKPASLPARAELRNSQRGKLWAKLVWSAALGLIGLILTMSFVQLIETLVARSLWLSWAAIGLVSVLGIAALVFVFRELRGLRRLRRIDGLRSATDQNWQNEPRQKAVALSDRVKGLYRTQSDRQSQLAQLEEVLPEALEAKDVIAQTERVLLEPIDQAALVQVRASARQVATATAFIPLALADVVAALVVNVRMIRKIATTYGARASLFGSVRLIRAVTTHLMATGAIALTDDLITSVAGGGLASKISRRFGEGIVNGALTVRVGIAAMDVCRPMPFAAVEKPKTRSEVMKALSDLFSAS